MVLFLMKFLFLFSLQRLHYKASIIHTISSVALYIRPHHLFLVHMFREEAYGTKKNF